MSAPTPTHEPQEWNNGRIAQATDAIDYREFGCQEWLEFHSVNRLLRKIRDDYEQRIQQQAARIAELERIIAYIDDHAPHADATCVEPGITLSQAARRAIKDMQS